jgi:hypothetical protein
MRLDLWLWLAGGVLALAAGLLRLLFRTTAGAPVCADPEEMQEPKRPARWGLRAPLALTCLALAALLAGLVWRGSTTGMPAWPSGAWLGGTSADGVALLTAGSLALLAWLLLRDTRRSGSTEPGGWEVGAERDRAASEALALFGSCLLACLAIGAAWVSPLPAAATGSWLVCLRVLAASLGLGAWLPALAAESHAFGRDVRRVRRPRTGSPAATGAGVGFEAMRAAYPLLTAAWLLGAAWNLAAFAAPWRGVAPEALLLTAWLLGAIYLIACWGERPARLPSWALFLLTACGSVAAVLQAWLTPLLLS